jgi:hypothetical protein
MVDDWDVRVKPDPLRYSVLAMIDPLIVKPEEPWYLTCDLGA